VATPLTPPQARARNDGAPPLLRNNRTLMFESLYIDQDPTVVQISLNNQALVRSLLLVFMVCWTWSIVLAGLALADVTADQPSTLWIWIMFCIFAPLQAFLNFAVRPHAPLAPRSRGLIACR